MKTLNRISDLEQYGLEYLTGEACALSQRLLFDMNEDGVALVAEYFGIPTYPLPAFAPNWISTVNGKPAVASILLPRTPEFYRDLFKFLLFREGYEVVVAYDGAAIGATEAEAEDSGYCLAPGVSVHHNPRIPGQPSIGTRNVHAMSGRSN